MAFKTTNEKLESKNNRTHAWYHLMLFPCAGAAGAGKGALLLYIILFVYIFAQQCICLARYYC